MSSLYSVGALIFSAAATPGPNTLVAARLGALRRWDAVLWGVVAIGLGGLILLAAAWFGLALARGLVAPLELAGAIYLVWLGVSAMLRTGDGGKPPVGRSFAGLVAFQLVNPKAWVLVLTAVAATRGHGEGLAQLSILFLVISATSLLAWAAGGAVAARRLTERLQHRIEMALGFALAASGIGIIVNVFI